jgi:hypothetical protein
MGDKMAFFSKKESDDAKQSAPRLTIDQAQTGILDAVTSQFGDSQTALPDFSVVAGWASADFIAFRSFDIQIKVGVTPENPRDQKRLKCLVAVGPRFVSLYDLLETDLRSQYKRQYTPENLRADLKLLQHYLAWRLTPEQRAKFGLTQD